MQHNNRITYFLCKKRKSFRFLFLFCHINNENIAKQNRKEINVATIANFGANSENRTGLSDEEKAVLVSALIITKTK